MFVSRTICKVGRTNCIHWLIAGIFACLLTGFAPNAISQEAASDAPPAEESVETVVIEDEVTISSGVGVPAIAYLIPVFGLLGLGFTYWKSSWVAQQEVGTEKMARIAASISEGAMSFLKAEYTFLVIFVAAVAILLGYAGGTQGDSSSPLIALSFATGAFSSALAGFIGMRVATKANVRTTNAARTSLGAALEVAFAGGSVMGMGVVGLGVLGLSVLFVVYGTMFGLDSQANITRVITVLTGFSFGASSIALFARVGGGIYTKAADVGADLVGKVEAGIPEDHPLNPATIADNVGDNVGDVAGMGADLFESYVGSIIGTMVLGAAFFTAFNAEGADNLNGLSAVLLPLVLAGVGILTSIAGTFFVKVKEGGNPHHALNVGEFGSAAILLVLTYAIIKFMLPGDLDGRRLCYERDFRVHQQRCLLCNSVWFGRRFGDRQDHRILHRHRDGTGQVDRPPVGHRIGHEHHRRVGCRHDVDLDSDHHHRAGDHRRLFVRRAVWDRDCRGRHACPTPGFSWRLMPMVRSRTTLGESPRWPSCPRKFASGPTNWMPSVTPRRRSERDLRLARRL